MLRVLFLGKADDRHVERAFSFCRNNFATQACLGRHGDPLPDLATAWTGDAIVSYLSRWIVPKALLSRARVSINFHPAPPEYPGIGCTNFAIYDVARDYGVTCHHMADQVDRGDIIAVRRFPILASDDVAALLERTYDYQLALFYDVMGALVLEDALPQSPERWRRRPYTQRDLNELARISPEMSAEEVGRRVRSTTYQEWRPELRVHGFRFVYQPEPR